jgi:hypothetical protein
MSHAFDVITARVVSLLEAGTVPWRKPWANRFSAPRNLISRRRLDTIRKRFGTLGGRAYWINGASGVGKTTIARLIANEVAGCDYGVFELDASELTTEFLADFQRRVVGRPLGGSGWGVHWAGQGGRFASMKRTG